MDNTASGASTAGTADTSPVKKGSNKSTGVIIAIIIGALLLCGACVAVAIVAGSYMTSSFTSVFGSITPTNTAEPVKTYQVGEKAVLGDIELTVYDFEDNVVSSDIYTKPETGYRFVAVEVKVTNNGSETEYASGYDFTIKDSDDYSYEYAWETAKKPAFNTGDIKDGASIRGWITFELPVDAENLRLVYQPNWISEGQVIVELE